MKPLRWILAFAMLGALATEAHAGGRGWYRVLGPNMSKRSEEQDLMQRHALGSAVIQQRMAQQRKKVKVERPHLENHLGEEHLRAERVREEGFRRGERSRFTPLVGSSREGAIHTAAAKSFIDRDGDEPVTIAARLGGSQGHAIQASNVDRIFKHNSNLFLKPTPSFTFWRNQWRGGMDDHHRIFSFNN